MAVRVVCLGNELVSDDGIGIRVGRVLRALSLPEGVSVEMHPHVGIEMLELLHADEHLILVDATVTGASPGTCRTLVVDEIEALAQRPVCCHGLGVAEVLAAARRLDPERVPLSVRLVGVEAQVLDRFGTALSPALRDALPAAVHEVLRCLGADEALLQLGEREAERWKDWEPNPIDSGE
jgi:hydrogenase maturation protease